jgi:hypothetical protein
MQDQLTAAWGGNHIGSMISAYYVAYALTALAAGLLLDRYGAARVIPYVWRGLAKRVGYLCGHRLRLGRRGPLHGSPFKSALEANSGPRSRGLGGRRKFSSPETQAQRPPLL